MKIPNNIKVLYFFEKNIIILIGAFGQKSIKLKLKLFIDYSKNLVWITNIPVNKSLIKKKKLINSLQGTITALLKQIVLEISVILNKKLELIGVGYKVFLSKMSDNYLLHFRLGFSHSLFFKIDSDKNVFTYKFTNVYFFGNSLNNVTQLAAKIKSYKIPEPYKGKGILYKNEKIKLKEGKKI